MHKRVVFACTQTPDRSLMAAGLLRTAAAGRFTGTAAGETAVGPSALAVTVMHEVGSDIQHDRARTLDQAAVQRWEVSISLCDPLSET